MSLFARRRPSEQPEERALIMPTGPSWPAVNTYAGKSVGFDSAMRSAAAAACQRVLVASIVSLPVDVVRVQRNKRTRVEGADVPQIIRQPSQAVSPRTWRAQVVRSLVGAGNAYAWVRDIDGQGQPTRMDTIHPDCVHWVSNANELYPMVSGQRADLTPGGNLWHLPVSFLVPPGQPYALSPVDMARESIATSLAAEEFGSRFFGDGGLPIGWYEVPQVLNGEQAQQLKDMHKRMIAGRRDPGVVSGGVKFNPSTIKPDETQFVDLMQFEVLQACRFWGVPPAMVFAAVSGQNVTYANVTDADLFFLKHSLSHWLTDFESALSSMIVAPQVVKFNVDAILRMDTLKRYQVHEIALRNKLTSVNRVLALEDQDPWPGDEYNQPGVPGGTDPPDGGAP